MARWAGVKERRQFGRRDAAHHAWVQIPGRPLQPCYVRNLSEQGALLEFDDHVWTPFRFRLTIDASKLDIWCEVKHQGDHVIGVRFIQASTEPAA